MKNEAIIKTVILECLRRMQRCMNALSDFCLFDYYTCSLPCLKPIRLRYKARQPRGYFTFHVNHYKQNKFINIITLDNV